MNQTFLPLRYEYTIHTQIKTHTLQVLESALKCERQKRLSGLLPLAFEGCQTSDFHLVNQQKRPTKAENTSSVLGLEWEGKREEKRKRDRQNYGVFSCPSPLWCPQWKWHLLHSPFHHLCRAHHSGSAEVKMEKRTLSKASGAIKRVSATATCRTGAAPWCSSALMREDDE